MRITEKLLAILLSTSLLAYAQGNTFDKVRYNGGTISTRVDPKDWNNKLTVTADLIVLTLKDGQRAEIPPKSVTSLSYGQEAHRRVGTMIALAVLVAPVALFGLLHKTRLHFIGVQYKTPDGRSGGILLQGDKDNYRAILVALQGVTGVPVNVSEKEREFIPVGVTASVTKEPAEAQTREEKTSVASTQGSGTGTSNANPSPESPAEELAPGTVNVTSNPDGADVYADGQFVGNCPAVLKLKPGKHTVTVKLSGHRDWSREISVGSGSEVRLTATLE
jgi:hypothetical protein